MVEPRKTSRSTIPGTRLGPPSSYGCRWTRSGRMASLHRARRVELARLGLENEIAQAQTAAPPSVAARLDLSVHQVRHAQEVGHVGIGGLVVDLLGGAELDDAAVVHHGQAIGHRERLFLVVGDVQEGDPDLLLQRAQLDLEGAAELGVKRPERLVEQQHRRTQDQCPGQGDALLLAARKLVGASLLVARTAAPARAPPPLGC